VVEKQRDDGESPNNRSQLRRHLLASELTICHPMKIGFFIGIRPCYSGIW
jgi:hypothetical protein